jgi:hypothetical protein
VYKTTRREKGRLKNKYTMYIPNKKKKGTGRRKRGFSLEFRPEPRQQMISGGNIQSHYILFTKLI